MRGPGPRALPATLAQPYPAWLGHLRPRLNPLWYWFDRRALARMREAAAAEGARLLTLTIEAEVGFAAPAEFDAFSDALAEAVAALARKYPAAAGRRYRLTAAAHPAVNRPATVKN